MSASSMQAQLSICIPTYNQAQYISQCLESLRAQSFANYSVYICDDASTDDTAEQVSPFIDSDPRLEYSLNQVNLGAVKNAEHCTQKADTKLVTIFQSDDYYLNNRFLEQAVELFRDNPELQMVIGNCTYVTDDGQPFQVNQLYPEDRLLEGRDALHDLLLLGGFWPSAAIFRLDTFKKIGGFMASSGVGQDLHCAFRMCLQGKVAYLSEPSVAARWHANSISVRYQRQLDTEIQRILKMFRQEVLDDPQITLWVDKAIAAYNSPHRAHYSASYLEPLIHSQLSLWGARKVAIFGAGRHTENLFNWTDLEQANIIGLVDNNESLQGQMRFGLPVIAPEKILTLHPDIVVISSASYQDEIKQQLSEQLPQNVEIITLY